MADPTDKMESIINLCKRRGFVFPSSDIYGGFNGFFDYGPLGVEADGTHLPHRDALHADRRTGRDTFNGESRPEDHGNERSGPSAPPGIARPKHGHAEDGQHHASEGASAHPADCG